MAAIKPKRNMITQMLKTIAVIIVEIIPQTFPTSVLLRPPGSIVPASIAFKSSAPKIHARIPSGMQTTRLKMPRMRINWLRCGLSGRGFCTRLRLKIDFF
jgi:hypothetical protein